MKKIYFAFAIALIASASQASYLFWQVDTDVMSQWNASSAYLYAGSTQIDKLVSVGNSQSIDVSSYENYSFWVELVNSSGTVVAQTGDAATYASLAGNMTTSELSVPQMGAWHGGTVVVPEPTSGVLMIVGLALLGLKRRKA